MNNRKVGIIGVGHVGAHVAYSLAIQGIVDELVLADTDTARVESEYQDLLDALPHMPHRTRVSIGEYEDLADCDLIVNSAGHIELLLGSDDRSRELKFTIPAVHTWVDRVRKAGFDGVVLNISNPCDAVTREIAKGLGLPKGRVLGTGTGLDSARLVTQIVKKTNVDPNSIQAFMFGEHGNSMFAAWSCVTVNGLSIDEMAKQDPRWDFDRPEVEQLGRHGGWVTFSWKHATEYSVSTTAARMVKAILHDEKILMPASTELNGEYGQRDVYAGVPCIIGKDGVERIVEFPLTQEELDKFNDSCNAIRVNIKIADSL